MAPALEIQSYGKPVRKTTVFEPFLAPQRLDTYPMAQVRCLGAERATYHPLQACERARTLLELAAAPRS